MTTSTATVGPGPELVAGRWWARERIQNAGVLLATSTLLVLLWHLAVVFFDLPSYLLPKPLAVGQAFFNGITASPTSEVSLIYQMALTMRAAMIGFGVAAILGIILGTVAAQSRLLERLLMPYVFGLQSMPKIAIAPLLMIWFGFGVTSKAALAGLLTFFPVMVNTYTGMSIVDRDMVRLFRSLRASKFQTLVRLNIPAAAPMIFAGIDIAVVQALLGAVVAEFIAGQDGIGTQLIRYQYINNTAGVFAALLTLALTGILLHGLVSIVKRRVIYWHEDPRDAGQKV